MDESLAATAVYPRHYFSRSRTRNAEAKIAPIWRRRRGSRPRRARPRTNHEARRDRFWRGFDQDSRHEVELSRELLRDVEESSRHRSLVHRLRPIERWTMAPTFVDANQRADSRNHGRAGGLFRVHAHRRRGRSVGRLIAVPWEAIRSDGRNRSIFLDLPHIREIEGEFPVGQCVIAILRLPFERDEIVSVVRLPVQSVVTRTGSARLWITTNPVPIRLWLR